MHTASTIPLQALAVPETSPILQRKFKVKALSRDTTKAWKYFGDADGLQVCRALVHPQHAVAC